MYIVATGMVCPVGLSAASACAAFRAKIAAFCELPYKDNRGEPIVGAMVPGIAAVPRRAPELVDLLVKSLDGLLKAQPKLSWDRVPLLVGLAEPDRPGGRSDLAGSIVARLQERSVSAFNPNIHEHSPRVTRHRSRRSPQPANCWTTRDFRRAWSAASIRLSTHTLFFGLTAASD